MTRVVVTCGPSYEPIDDVRRLTNFSTGELGILLANQLASAGYDVLCFKGVGASCTHPVEGAKVIPFTTNECLKMELESIAEPEAVGAVFHTAALCDYKVKSVHRRDGTELAALKIPSREGELLLSLVPAEKVITQLRWLFPVSRIVGWKYELNGSRAETFEKAVRQIEENRSDACVVNGQAYGPGFGVVQPGEETVYCPDKMSLCAHLVGWLGIKVSRR